MRGHKKRVILQERDRKLLESLASYRVVDRAQAMQLAPFHSVSRANARLLQLVRAGVLSRSIGSGFGSSALYRLPRTPASWRGQSIRHQLAVNRIRLMLEQEGTVLLSRTFQKPLSQRYPLIPDGYVELDTPAGILSLFLEVDLGSEERNVLSKKAQGYLALAGSGEFTRLFGREQFRIALVCETERRARSLASAILSITDKLFFIGTTQTINSEGFFSSIWLRPDGRENQSLV